MKEYIHYGCTEFDKRLFNPVRNERFVKPYGGFWASPVGSEQDWKSWCIDTNNMSWLNGGSFKFTLTDSAKVYHIYSVMDLYALPNDPRAIVKSSYCIDFEACIRSGIDAIQLHLSDEEDKPELFMDGLYWRLYGWDVDSILIFNPDIIVMKGE